MNENLTWIVEVLDSSGSMKKLKAETIESHNDFIEEQKTVEGEAACFLTKFNTRIEKVYENKKLEEIELLNENTYTPASYTRLYDALGVTIKEIKEKIKSLPDEEKPGKVLFVIITDGLENDSKQYNKDKVFEMISKREKKGWNFIYLGANQDAMAEGGQIGINKFNTVTWDASSAGIKTAFMATNSYAKKYRMAKSMQEIQSLDLNQEYKDASNNS